MDNEENHLFDMMMTPPSKVLDSIRLKRTLDDIVESGLYSDPSKQQWEIWFVDNSQTPRVIEYMGFSSYELGTDNLEEFFFEIIGRWSTGTGSSDEQIVS